MSWGCLDLLPGRCDLDGDTRLGKDCAGPFISDIECMGRGFAKVVQPVSGCRFSLDGIHWTEVGGEELADGQQRRHGVSIDAVAEGNAFYLDRPGIHHVSECPQYREGGARYHKPHPTPRSPTWTKTSL